jgi:predicted GNAT family acetyltransferase
MEEAQRMERDLDNVTVKNNEGARRYEAQIEGHLASIEYQRTGDCILFTHIEVPEALEGHGIAAKLAHTALEDARAQHLTVIPLYPFVASYIRNHMEYSTLVPPDSRERVLGN